MKNHGKSTKVRHWLKLLVTRFVVFMLLVRGHYTIPRVLFLYMCVYMFIVYRNIIEQIGTKRDDLSFEVRSEDLIKIKWVVDQVTIVVHL